MNVPPRSIAILIFSGIGFDPLFGEFRISFPYSIKYRWDFDNEKGGARFISSCFSSSPGLVSRIPRFQSLTFPAPALYADADDARNLTIAAGLLIGVGKITRSRRQRKYNTPGSVSRSGLYRLIPVVGDTYRYCSL